MKGSGASCACACAGPDGPADQGARGGAGACPAARGAPLHAQPPDVVHHLPPPGACTRASVSGGTARQQHGGVQGTSRTSLAPYSCSTRLLPRAVDRRSSAAPQGRAATLFGAVRWLPHAPACCQSSALCVLPLLTSRAWPQVGYAVCVTAQELPGAPALPAATVPHQRSRRDAVPGARHLRHALAPWASLSLAEHVLEVLSTEVSLRACPFSCVQRRC